MNDKINPNLVPAALNQSGKANEKEPADVLQNLSPEQESAAKVFQEQLRRNEKGDTANLSPDMKKVLEQDPQVRSQLAGFQQLSPEQQSALLELQSQSSAQQYSDALVEKASNKMAF